MTHKDGTQLNELIRISNLIRVYVCAVRPNKCRNLSSDNIKCILYRQ